MDKLLKCLILLGLVVAVTAVPTVIFMLLWNAVVAGIFGGPELTLLQAFLVSCLLSFIGSAFRK